MAVTSPSSIMKSMVVMSNRLHSATTHQYLVCMSTERTMPIINKTRMPEGGVMKEEEIG